MTIPKPPILLSSLDLKRLEALLDKMPLAEAERHEALASELARAEVVEPAAIPANVVTMNSRVTFEDEATGDATTVTLVYPSAAGAAGTVSILAPVGSALLGLAKGQHIDWPTPDGHERRLRVLDISYQPEAAGDLHR
ncbi:nucleoside diphosphate kinase regulator [Dyella sp. GSA-30]|uniref:nucleoside diphosphate kinase regulator n=1 Tax=Dyella sp. GSA-30 TaxID=2994496 RepID=UPI00249143CA|nr:nucleoside diphosphate kinase regulator [Dyella sp. GSA-30]BDU22065.1 nucleoside diphosphate kinase regulator [Dyella sp. GSA-30]